MTVVNTSGECSICSLLLAPVNHFVTDSILIVLPHTLFLLVVQINVATQRGFVPVDERMRVTDADGKVVGT